MKIVSGRWCKHVVVAVLDVLLHVSRFTKQMDVGFICSFYQTDGCW